MAARSVGSEWRMAGRKIVQRATRGSEPSGASLGAPRLPGGPSVVAVFVVVVADCLSHRSQPIGALGRPFDHTTQHRAHISAPTKEAAYFDTPQRRTGSRQCRLGGERILFRTGSCGRARLSRRRAISPASLRETLCVFRCSFDHKKEHEQIDTSALFSRQRENFLK